MSGREGGRGEIDEKRKERGGKGLKQRKDRNEIREIPLFVTCTQVKEEGQGKEGRRRGE